MQLNLRIDQRAPRLDHAGLVLQRACAVIDPSQSSVMSGPNVWTSQRALLLPSLDIEPGAVARGQDARRRTGLPRHVSKTVGNGDVVQGLGKYFVGRSQRFFCEQLCTRQLGSLSWLATVMWRWRMVRIKTIQCIRAFFQLSLGLFAKVPCTFSNSLLPSTPLIAP